MTATTVSHDTARAEALAEQIFGATLGAWELLTVWLGDKLGLYEALRDHGPATVTELSSRTGVHPRYAREWLEQQSVMGVLDAEGDGAARTFTLPPANADVVCDGDSPLAMAHLTWFTPAIAGIMPALRDAFTTGAGVPYASYGDDARTGQALFNRWAFRHQLTQEWLPAIPAIEATLRDGGRVADLACGYGYSSVAIAQAYPGVRVDGYDNDEASIARARTIAAEGGVADRVTFTVRDASLSPAAGGYDLVTIFEALHDLGRPVEALRTARTLLAPGGRLLVMDERVPEDFTAPGEPLERFFYAASVLYCLPQGLADGPEPAGTVFRASALRELAERAGFGTVEEPAIDHPQFRFYVLSV